MFSPIIPGTPYNSNASSNRTSPPADAIDNILDVKIDHLSKEILNLGKFDISETFEQVNLILKDKKIESISEGKRLRDIYTLSLCKEILEELQTIDPHSKDHFYEKTLELFEMRSLCQENFKKLQKIIDRQENRLSVGDSMKHQKSNLDVEDLQNYILSTSEEVSSKVYDGVKTICQENISLLETSKIDLFEARKSHRIALELLLTNQHFFRDHSEETFQENKEETTAFESLEALCSKITNYQINNKKE